VKQITWGRAFECKGELPTTTMLANTINCGAKYTLGTWWLTVDGEIVEELKDVRYPDCVNWECFA